MIDQVNLTMLIGVLRAVKQRLAFGMDIENAIDDVLAELDIVYKEARQGIFPNPKGMLDGNFEPDERHLK